MSRLDDLDKRFIAVAAPKVAGWIDAVRSRRVKAPAAQAPAGQAPAAPAPAREPKVKASRELDFRNLGALDEKFAAKGALAFLREVPQLMAFVIAVVFVAGTLAALSDHHPSSSPEQTVSSTGGGAADPGPATLTLGPAVGDSVSTYLTTSAQSLTTIAKSDPDGARFALVSLTGYYRPAQVESIVSGYVVKQVWLRDAAAGKDASQFPLQINNDLITELRSAYARTAAAQAISRAKYQELADTTAVGDDFKPYYTHYADVARVQAQAYRSNCACVFAALVSATPAQLLSLRHRPGVRALELSGKDLDFRDLQITPLLPEVTGIVPNPAEDVAPPS